MLFNSYIFIFCFLPIAAIGFFALSRFHLQKIAFLWLAFTSLFFYGYWNVSYLPLFIISISINYTLGKTIERVQNSRFFLVLGIIFNLGLLGYFKYSQFFLDSFHQVFNFQVPAVNIILPLAISFYSFTQIAYLVDAYRGQTKVHHYNLLSYSLFISFFPQLIAGPILRYNELVPQFQKSQLFILSQKNIAMGLTLFILGLSKKVAIADNLSPWVANIFQYPHDITILEAWLGSLAYTLQLYFDFSGYSDMAIGLGWLFNIHLPINFNSPYKAISIIDFWRRWHITLSHFLRDYLYIPLGGNRLGKIRQYLNLMITMLLGGLWHGAGWTFIIWGGLHGSLLVINNIWRSSQWQFSRILGWLLTFFTVVLSWVIFRASNLKDAIEIIQTMLGINSITLPNSYQTIFEFIFPFTSFQYQGWSQFSHFPDIGFQKSILVIFCLILGVVFLPNTQEIMERFKPTLPVAFCIGLLATFCLISLNQVSEFLYFQF